MKGRLGRRRKQLLDDVKGVKRILEIEGGRTRFILRQKWLWNRLLTCRKADYMTLEYLQAGRGDEEEDKAATLANDQLDAQFFLNTFITILYMYMFRAISCSSSGGQIVTVRCTPVHRTVTYRQ